MERPLTIELEFRCCCCCCGEYADLKKKNKIKYHSKNIVGFEFPVALKNRRGRSREFFNHKT